MNRYNTHKSDVILIVTHKIDKAVIDKYRRVKQEAVKHDVLLLVNDEDGYLCRQIPEDVVFHAFSVDMLNSLSYEPIAETIVPGSNHFALMWFYLMNPQYRNYWNLEYDVDFTGSWSTLFNAFSDVQAGFVSCHIQRFCDNPYWYWWNTYKGRLSMCRLKNGYAHLILFTGYLTRL